MNLDNKINFSADKIRISVEQILQVMKQVNLTEILDKTDRDEKRWNSSKTQTKYLLEQLQ